MIVFRIILVNKDINKIYDIYHLFDNLTGQCYFTNRMLLFCSVRWFSNQVSGYLIYLNCFYFPEATNELCLEIKTIL